MWRQLKGRHYVLLGAATLPLVFTLVLIPLHQSPTYEHRIVFEPPGFAIVAQQETLVLMFGDYKSRLKAINAQARAQTPAAILSELLGRKNTPPSIANPQAEPDPPPVQVAGYALMTSDGYGALVDCWLGRVYWDEWGGPTLLLIRTPLSRLAIVLVLPPLLLLALLLLRIYLARRRESAGVCAQCGYDIRATAEPRCPECGAPFGRIARDAYEFRLAAARQHADAERHAEQPS